MWYYLEPCVIGKYFIITVLPEGQVIEPLRTVDSTCFWVFSENLEVMTLRAWSSLIKVTLRALKCFSGKFCWETLKGSITGTLRASGFLSEKIPTMKIPTRKVNNPLTFQRILNEPLINPFLRSFLKEIYFFFF